MGSTLSSVVLPTLLSGMRTLATLVDKAQAHAEANTLQPASLLEARLRPDMFSFAGQIEMAVGTTRRGIARLQGEEPGENAAPEATFDALSLAIKEAIAFLETVDAAAIDAYEEKSFQVSFGPTHTMEFTGFSYAHVFLLPNTMFHISTAYNILRERGVGLGKLDLLGAYAATFGVRPVA